MPSLEGRSIEEFATALFNREQLGYAGLNHGLMLLVAPRERKVRIEVGCGREDVVSDDQAEAVLNAQVMPAFRSGDFAGGVHAGAGALMALARKKTVPAAYRPAQCTLRGAR